MKIVVCVKQVPDSAAQLTIRDGKPDWGGASLVMNPWDEFAVEAALQQAESLQGEVVAVTIGDEGSKDTLKHALAMGCAKAILINDPALISSDSLIISQALAAAIRKISEDGEPVQLAIFGRQAIDTDTGTTAIQSARWLNWSSLYLVSTILSLDTNAGLVEVERNTEEGKMVVASKLPAVISVVKDIAEPRYPSFLGIRKASRAEIPTWGVLDLNLGEVEPSISWVDVALPQRREVQTEMISGNNSQEIAEKLVDRIIEEKVL